MKKLLLLCTAFAVSITVFSQARFGLKGGLNLANQKIKASFMGQSFGRSGDGIVSFHIGGVADIPITPYLSFRPELLLSGKGMNFQDEDDMGNPIDARLRPFYLELPLNLVYVYETPSGPRIFGGAGPSLAYGVFGKAKSEGASEDVFDDGGFKRFDFGINILGGVELTSGLTFSINVTPGLANIIESEDGGFSGADIKWRNNCWGFSVGYMFDRK